LRWRGCLLVERGGVAKPGGNFFEFDTGVANPEDSKAIQQEFALSDNMNPFPIAEEREADGAVGNGAVAEKFHWKRGGWRRWRRNVSLRAGRLLFCDLLRGRRRRGKFPTENVAAPTLIFRFASLFDTVVVELRIVDGKQFILMDYGGDVSGHNGLVMIEINKPNRASGQQKNGEQGELFLLLHAAALK
jgi:hypothetical protein